MGKYSLERKATMVSSVTAFLLMLIKFLAGIYSGSIAVLSSAIDSLMDLFVSIFNNFAVYLAEKTPNKKFNYGRGKIEALAALIEGVVIIVSGLYVFNESIKKFVFGNEVEFIGVSLLIMIISVSITGLLVFFLYNVAKKTGNLVIESDSLHYKTDLLTNSGILIGLIAIKYTGFYYIDAILGMMIAAYIIASAWDLIKKGFLLLLDISLDKNEVNKIKEIIKNNSKVEGYHDLKTRQSGNIKFVEVDIVLNPKMKLTEAHNISIEIEKLIKKIDLDVQWDIVIHMDPFDDKD